MDPIVVFSAQFTLSLLAYGLIAAWYVAPRLARLPREVALVLLLWVHAFRIIGGAILAPGSVADAVPLVFRQMIGIGDMVAAALAILALIALRVRSSLAIGIVWVFVVFALGDTVNAMIQSLRFDVPSYPLGINWTIVTIYVPALIVSAVLILIQLLAARPARGAN